MKLQAGVPTAAANGSSFTHSPSCFSTAPPMGVWSRLQGQFRFRLVRGNRTKEEAVQAGVVKRGTHDLSRKSRSQRSVGVSFMFQAIGRPIAPLVSSASFGASARPTLGLCQSDPSSREEALPFGAESQVVESNAVKGRVGCDDRQELTDWAGQSDEPVNDPVFHGEGQETAAGFRREASRGCRPAEL